MAAVCMLPAAVFSQSLEVGPSGKITIVPRVSVTETYTSNVALSSVGRKSELITEISPGINIRSTGGRISGSLDYSLSEILYARNTSGSQTQNSLNAIGTIEVLDKRGYIDFNGVITQQAISAFGTPVTSGTSLNGNSTETSLFRLSPHIDGRFGDVAEYRARYSITTTRSAASAVSDVDARDLSLGVNSTGSRIGSGWTFGLSRQSFDYGNGGRSTAAQQINGQFNYPFNTQIGGYIKGVRESNDYQTLSNQQESYSALGLNWTPNEEARLSIDKDTRGATGIVGFWAPSKRTSVQVTRQRQLYGDTHSVILSYRTPDTAWTFSDTRGASTSIGIRAVNSPPSLYDILYGQFIAGETDPIKREQFDAFLRSVGIIPNATAVTGFLTSTVTLQRQQQLSFALFGGRSTLSLVATRSNTRALDTLSGAVDDLSNGGSVTQNGLTANYSYRLTPRAVLSVIAARQTTAASLAQPGNTLRSVNVNLTANLTRETTATVGARRVVFDSNSAPYNETAVIGNLNVQF